MALAATQNIALIGFMAVGKSAVGRNLAKRLRRRFVDLDRLIEKNQSMKVREIFKQKGEDYFRQCEKQTLAQVLSEPGQVIATGGGVVLDDENLAWLREKSLLVCLGAATDTILRRVGNGASRPLLKGANRRERIEELFQARQARYAQAHVTIATDQLTLNEVVDKIIALIQTGE
ncbi:MAG: shikimate kinase [Deltaproteobacteria bacterium]|nr:shikimate kinase [Deltaproteobacteria bacterium]